MCTWGCPSRPRPCQGSAVGAPRHLPRAYNFRGGPRERKHVLNLYCFAVLQPGYEREMGTSMGDAHSREYNAVIREATVGHGTAPPWRNKRSVRLVQSWSCGSAANVAARTTGAGEPPPAPSRHALPGALGHGGNAEAPARGLRRGGAASLSAPAALHRAPMRQLGSGLGARGAPREARGRAEGPLGGALSPTDRWGHGPASGCAVAVWDCACFALDLVSDPAAPKVDWVTRAAYFWVLSTRRAHKNTAAPAFSVLSWPTSSGGMRGIVGPGTWHCRLPLLLSCRFTSPGGPLSTACGSSPSSASASQVQGVYSWRDMLEADMDNSYMRYISTGVK